MNIVFLDAKTLGEDVDFSLLEKYGELTIHPLTAFADIVPRAIDADILIVNKVVLDKAVLTQLPKLKLICEAATGTDNIDIEFAKSKDISVNNVVGYSTDSVVQHTFTMLFYFLNNLSYYQEYTNSLGWTKSQTFSHYKSFSDIAGMKWGIIGLGNIGEKVASIANNFGAEVQYFSTSGKNNNSNYNQVSLEELLTSSDIITIHAPLNNNTKNLISKTELALCSKGCILLNLGRGGIINEEDMKTFIQEDLLNIGLDVLSSEPMPSDHCLVELLDHKNLLITPHIAWASINSRKKLLEGISLNISRFLTEK